ncbi:MAG: FAD-binding protein [Anaerolineae bacterium]
MKIQLNSARCTGCGICTEICPQKILELRDALVHVRDQDRCMGCFGCEDECPSNAIRVFRAPRGVSEIHIEPPPESVTAATGDIACDVAIVGAGPAGLGAAITCARAGLDVLVLERLPNRTISHHTDGGILFTLPWMTSIHVEDDTVHFPELDISLRAGFIRPCGAMGLLGPGGLSTDNTLPEGTEGWAGNKDRFVKALVDQAEEAGARIWFNAKVVDVLQAGGRVSGVILDSGAQVRSSVVVTADGAFAHISERAGLQISHDDLWYASLLAFEYDNIAGLPAGLYYLNGDLQFEGDLPGAIGGVAITDVVHVMIGFFSRNRTYPAPEPLDHYLQRLVETDGRLHTLLGDSLQGATPHMLNGCRSVFRAECNTDTAGDGVISVGDAWVDDGELGNVPALANGVHAGRVIVQAAGASDFSKAALSPANDFLDQRLLRALAENKRMKLMGAQLDEEQQRQMFLFMQHLNYPVMMFGSPGQQNAMFAKFMLKNLFRFFRYPKIARLFF